MSGKRKVLVGLLAVMALASVVTVGTVLAETPTPTSGAGQTAYQNFLDKLAANLGVQVDTLKNAITKTQTQIVDEQVQSGKLTQEQADKIKDRIQNGQGWFGFKGGFVGPKGWKGGPKLNGALNLGSIKLEALAALTNKTVDQVKQELSLQRFLDENEITSQQLHDKIVELAQAKVDQAVKDGKITAAQGEQIMNRIKSAPALPQKLNGHWRSF